MHTASIKSFVRDDKNNLQLVKDLIEALHVRQCSMLYCRYFCKMSVIHVPMVDECQHILHVRKHGYEHDK